MGSYNSSRDNLSREIGRRVAGGGAGRGAGGGAGGGVGVGTDGVAGAAALPRKGLRRGHGFGPVVQGSHVGVRQNPPHLV